MNLPSPAAACAPTPSPADLASPVGHLLERSAGAMALAELGGAVTYVNRAFLALWEFESSHQVLGRDAAAEFWADPPAAQNALRALSSQAVWQGELTAVTARGRRLPLRVTAQLILDGQGAPAAWMGNFVDISAEHATRAVLAAERSFTEMVLGAASVLLLALDEEGRVVRFNRECERLSGWSSHEILGRCLWDTVLPPEQADQVRREVLGAASDDTEPGKATRHVHEWATRGGERRRIDWTHRVVREPGTQRLVLVSVGTDITARHLAEQSLARSEAQLRAAQAVACMGSWTLDLGSGQLDWSDEVFRIFELDRDRFGASYEAFLATIHPDDRAPVDAAFQASLTTRRPYRIEHRLVMPDGRIKWVEERCESDFDPAGTPLRSRGTVQDVTERHLHEVELRRFRLMVDYAPQEIWLTDDRLRVAYANAAACASLGYTFDELKGRAMAQIDAGGEAAVQAIMEAVDAHRSSDGAPQIFHVRHVAADGRWIPKEVYATVRDIDGRPYGISFARDISAQLRSQQALAASESLLRATLDAYPGWVACVDIEMRYVYVNAQFAQIVRRPADRIVGLTPDEVLGPRDRSARWEVHRRLAAGERAISVERRYGNVDGEERIVWIEYRRTEPEAREAGPLFYAFGHDVTELRSTQQRLALVTQDIGVGLWEAVLPTGEVEFNDELLSLLGFARDEVRDPAQDWFVSRIVPADRATRERVITSLLGGQGQRSQLQIRVQHRQGHVVWLQESLRVTSRDGEGRAQRLIGVLQDISTLKAREAELEANAAELEARVLQRTEALDEARREAERANAAKSDFLSQMSHELRTPLNAIMGFGQLLEMSPLPAEDAEHVQEVMHAGRHLLELIDDVLDLARVESGRLRLQTRGVPLAPLVMDCVALISPMAREADVALELGEIPPDAVVQADPGRLRQVLLNLLSNAVKYNRTPGRVAIAVSAAGQGAGAWELRVSDSGPGLTPEQVDRLFQPFERLGAARTGVEGTGIGLSISRRLAELMGGRLTLAEPVAPGCTFVLAMPRIEAGVAGAPAPGRDPVLPGPAVPAPQGRRARILYVEDNVVNQRLMTRLLKDRGELELHTAASVHDTLALLRTWTPDLLLIDIQLPDGDGLSLLRELRHSGVGCPAIAVSANGMPADVARGRAAGFDAYLTKPLDLAQVRQCIDRHLAIEAADRGRGER